MGWTEADWLAEATAWIREQVEVTGEIEQPHVREWSTVLRVPSAAGTLWFKAVSPVHGFEPGLTALLARLRPSRVPEVVAVDADRAWMLMADGGTRFRDLPAAAADWERVLPGYAELQIAVTPLADELLGLGVPDRRLDKLPAQLQGLVGDHPELGACLPEAERLVEELTAHGIPATIQHDDLHDGQVFVRDGQYRIFDWGDSCVSHPFHTLTVTLRAAAWALGLEPGGVEILRMRDAYLEPFGPSEELAPIANVAYRTGTLARALAWTEDDDPEAVGYGIRRFLENGPIGTWDD
jgi:hypothetical protein